MVHIAEVRESGEIVPLHQLTDSTSSSSSSSSNEGNKIHRHVNGKPKEDNFAKIVWALAKISAVALLVISGYASAVGVISKAKFAILAVHSMVTFFWINPNGDKPSGSIFHGTLDFLLTAKVIRLISAAVI